MKLSYLLSVGVVLLTSQVTYSLEYHGYMRSGIGASPRGGDQVCFKAPGTAGIGSKPRLGNECDTYVELALHEQYRIGRSLTDPFFKTYVRFAMQSWGGQDWESTRVDSQKTYGSNPV